MAHWSSVLPVLAVDPKDWVRDFTGTLDRVLRRLDLPQDEDCPWFYETGEGFRTVSRTQARKPVHARGLGRWRAYEAELAPMIAELGAWHSNVTIF